MLASQHSLKFFQLIAIFIFPGKSKRASAAFANLSRNLATSAQLVYIFTSLLEAKPKYEQASCVSL